MLENNRFTPATIGAYKFSIPLYQRLFEWEEPQINQLLSDLYSSFKQDQAQPYYIGMLTTFKDDNAYSLVDGQQRFTVLTLMAIAFEWTDFLKVDDDKYRLSFFARNKDQEYLRNFGREVGSGYVNKKMKNGITTIKRFVNQKELAKQKTEFVKYIYNHATFFISELPQGYSIQELNKYFEAMNGTGKGLENHEILKVTLLKKLPEAADKVLYTTIWNAVSEMDKCLIRRKSNDKETAADYKSRTQNAMNALSPKEGAGNQLIDIRELFGFCNDFKKEAEANSDFKTIREIAIINKSPEKQYLVRTERAILSFSSFLLHVLWLQLSVEERKDVNDFFNIQKLQATFKNHLAEDAVELFFQNLLKYRILFDYYILRVDHSDQNNASYFLNFSSEDESETSTEKGSIEKQLLQYQSMLYVSTTSHLWLSQIIEYLVLNPANIKTDEFFAKLKEQDDNRCKSRNSKSFDYGVVDRYWFWRLDYYLWEKRNEHFEGESLEIANKYVFKANRSIEHVAPQNPEKNSNTKVSQELMNSFGNLAMISSGQNSYLQNQSFEVKRAHVEAFVNGSKNGSIESLKMLKIYDSQIKRDDAIPSHLNDFKITWGDGVLRLHLNEMLDVLIGSFHNTDSDITQNLKHLKHPKDA